MKATTALVVLSLTLSYASTTYADTFGVGATTFDIEFVTIGNPGNVADTTGNPSPPHPTGSVASTYRIGKFVISEDMIDKANAQSVLDSDPLGITKDTRGPDKPATSVSWYEAAQFVNWLNTSTGSTEAYKFDGGGDFQLWTAVDVGYDPNNLYRNSQATYFLPSVDEWYKAAYYDPAAGVYYDYPTGSDTPPTAVASGTAADTAVYDQSLSTGPADITLAGGLSPYSTAGQGGNVNEWEETDFDLVNDLTSSGRGARGGGWSLNSFGLLSSVRTGVVPSSGILFIGFRVASISEQSADFDDNGIVDGHDFLIWQRGYDPLCTSCTLADGDANGDHAVDTADEEIWTDEYGRVKVQFTTAVPEPSTFCLLLFATCLLVTTNKSGRAKTRTWDLSLIRAAL